MAVLDPNAAGGARPRGLDWRLSLRVGLAGLSLTAAVMKATGLGVAPLQALGLGSGALVGLGLLQLAAAGALLGARTARLGAVLLVGIGILGSVAISLAGGEGLLLSLLVPGLALVAAATPGPAGFRLRSKAAGELAGEPIVTAALGPLEIVTTGTRKRRRGGQRRQAEPAAEWALGAFATLEQEEEEA